jgi:hypothetical protein
MLKELAPTQPMLDALAKCFGEPVDASTIAIFEAIALNTKPVSKRGSVFEGAVSSLSTLRAMADHVTAGNFVKIHLLHNQGWELPKGNVFMAEVHGEELRALFYISRTTEEGQKLIADLNSGTIDEVSVGVMSAQLVCSECGWDYYGPDANMMHFFDRTCENDHTVGTDGVHVVMQGLNRWFELSLVSIGAAKGAKVVGRTKSVLGAEEYQRLAASGLDPDITTLFAAGGRVSSPEPKKEATMADEPKDGLSASAVLVQMTTLSADKAKVEVALTAAQTQVTDLTAQLSASTAKVAELEATVAAAAEGVKLKDEHAKVVAFLTEQVKAALVASGAPNPQVPETVDAMLAALAESKLKLHNLPVDQQMQAAEGNSQHKSNRPLGAFKLSR